MQVSASTSTAPTNSATRPIRLSVAKAARRRPDHEDVMPIPAASAAWWLTRASPRGQPVAAGSCRQRPDVFFEQRPGFLAGLGFHLAVEAGFLQHFLERLHVGIIEGHALAGQVLDLVGGHLLP